MTRMLWPAALIIAPMLLMLGVTEVMARFHGRARKRSPLKRHLLRSPGERLRAQIDDLSSDMMGYVALGMAVPSAFVLSYFLNPNTPRDPGLSMAAALIGGAATFGYVIYKFVQVVLKRRKLRLGYDAELAIGQELNQLLRDQYWVFHDVPFDRFNIDHIVVGRTGVFAVETKGRAKPIGKDGLAKWEAEYDGKRLQFPGWTETAPLEQAQRQADNLRQWLSSAVGESVAVSPVLALPGWYIKRTARGGVPLFNGTNSGRFFRDIGKAQLQEQLIARIVHQLDQKCRDVEPKAYGKARQKQLA